MAGENDDGEQFLQLDDLPASAIARISHHLDGLSLARVSAVSKRLLDIANTDRAWWTLLWSEHGVLLPPPTGPVPVGGGAQAAFGRLTAAGIAAPAPVKLRAVYTDGGWDLGGARWNPQYMFDTEPFKQYCSETGHNIHVIALVHTENAAARRHAERLEERRAFLQERCAHAADVLFNANAGPFNAPPPAPLSSWQTAELEELVAQLLEAHNVGHPLGDLLFHGVHNSNRPAVLARLNALMAAAHGPAGLAQAARRGPTFISAPWLPADQGTARRLQLIASPLATKEGDPFEAEVVDPFLGRGVGDGGGADARSSDRVVATARSLLISRRGDFSCPVAAAAVYAVYADADGKWPREEGVGLQSLAALTAHPRVRALDDVATVAGLTMAVAEGRFGPGCTLGPIHETDAGWAVEFQWEATEPEWPRAMARPEAAGAAKSTPSSVHHVRPMAWICFRSKHEARQRQLAHAGSDVPPPPLTWAQQHVVPGAAEVYDVLRLNLQGPWAAPAFLAKLIVGENLMSIVGDDHSEPNIDVQLMQVAGAVVGM